MKFSSLFVSSILHLSQASPIDTEARLYNSCAVDVNFFRRYWQITMTIAHDPAALCGELWDSLKKHWGKCAAFHPHCGRSNGFPEGLDWKFSTAHTCHGATIAEAFLDATNNKYGPLLMEGECRGV